MTITQRIELRRLGYTKEEIAEIAELEKTPTPFEENPASETPEQVEQPVQLELDLTETKPQVPDVQAELLTAINNLTAVLQNQKLNTTAQPEVKKESANDIFNNILKGR